MQLNKEDDVELDVKIKSMSLTKIEGKAKAFFDVSINDCITIKGFKLVDGISGFFVSMPREKSKNDEWFDRVIITDDVLKIKLETMALQHYGKIVKAKEEQNENIG